MKRYTATLVLTFIASIFVFSSCEKEKGSDPVVKTRTELITTGSWRFGSAIWGTTDAGPMLQACQKDNTIAIQFGGAGEMNEGATKCNAADPQTVPFTWSFQSGESEIFFSNPLFTGGSNTMSIVTLTEIELTLSQPLTVGGTTKTLSITFIH